MVEVPDELASTFPGDSRILKQIASDPTLPSSVRDHAMRIALKIDRAFPPTEPPAALGSDQ